MNNLFVLYTLKLFKKLFICSVPVWKAYTKRALKEVHFFTKVLKYCKLLLQQ